MNEAGLDQNSRRALSALSSAGDGAIVNLWADPTTHRLLVDLAAGAGTVTSVSVTTANGISGTVATSTTTPAITLTLGAITPTSVNGLTLAAQTNGFTIAGGTTSKTLTVPLDASVSGTNTGDNTVCTSGTATTAVTLATARAIYGNNFDGSAALTQVIASTYGGTGNGFTKFTGPTTAEKTFTLPDANAILLYSGGALGTPSGGTLTNCTGLPLTGLVDDTTTALGVGTIELGHASDTTLSRSAAGVLAVEGVVIPSISSTNTLTNKRITPRVSTEASSATPTINTDNVDAHSITAIATDITSMTTNLSGTPTNFQKLIIRIKDDGTARGITWGASFEAKGVALPTTTTISKVLTVGFIYDTVTSKWGCVASVEEA